MALEEKDVPNEFKVDETIADAIRARLEDEKISCTAAFAIARNFSIPPLQVGKTADVLQIHLSRCQLGLFGYPGKQGWTEERIDKEKPLPPGFEEAVRVDLDDEGQLSCAKAWQIATRFEIPRLQMGWFVEKMGISIKPCQLGAF